MTDWLGGVHKTCVPGSLIPSFLPFLQASQLSPFPLDSSPSSFPLLGTHGPSCRASSRARRPIRHLRDYPQLEKLARKEKKKKSGGWAEKRRGGSAGAWCGGRGIRPKAVGGRKPSREGRRPGLRGRRWNNTEDGSRSRASGGHARSARQCYRRRAASSTGPVSLTWDRVVSPRTSFPGPFT